MAKTIRGRNSRTSAKLAARDSEGKTQLKNGITDSALALARENNLNVSGLEGTGKDGRVILKDVRRALNGG